MILACSFGVYDLSQLATVGLVVKSTIVPTTLNKEVDTVVLNVRAFLNRLNSPRDAN
jgi:hypothetical protein